MQIKNASCCLLLYLCLIAKPKSSPTCPCPHYLQRRKIVSWLLSSWDPNSATADPLLKATPSGSTSGSQTLLLLLPCHVFQET
ncbi:hypothetical protein HID58_057738 [Brassica napus]|uniref:Secreted protein n=1 Tax=Brassica napus TaxID=3708 RepID=A0ABQ7XFI0_BRANA|nr:hypothetical protein HID58_057738 [Brassica napus]